MLHVRVCVWHKVIRGSSVQHVHFISLIRWWPGFYAVHPPLEICFLILKRKIQPVVSSYTSNSMSVSSLMLHKKSLQQPIQGVT